MRPEPVHDLDPVGSIGRPEQHERAGGRPGVDQHVGVVLGNDLRPRSGRIAEVDRHQASTRRVEFGAEIEGVAVGRHDVVGVGQFLDNGDHLPADRAPARILECYSAGVQCAAGVSARATGQHQPTAVGRHPRFRHPFVGLRPGPDECVDAGIVAEPVQHQLPRPHGGGELTDGRFRIAPVQEARFIGQPGRIDPLGPVQDVGQVAAAGHLPHPDDPPVRTGLGQGVREVPPAGADPDRRHRHGAVGGQQVRVNQQSRCRRQFLERICGEQLILIQVTWVGDDEIPPAAFPGSAPAWGGQQRGGERQQRRCAGERGEIRRGEGVLGVDEGAGPVRVRVLEIAERISDGDAVQDLGRVVTGGRRVVDGHTLISSRLRRQRCGGQSVRPTAGHSRQVQSSSAS